MRLLSLCPDDKAFPSPLHGHAQTDFRGYFTDNISLA